jgi:hypothetical protein
VQWWDLDLTSLFHGPQADKGSALASFFDSDSVLHAANIVSQHVDQWYLSSNTWAEQDLTATAKGPQVAAGTALCAFADGQVNHVIYDALDKNVHQLSGSWTDQNLNANVPAAVGSGLSSFVDNNGDAHVFYITSAGQHVHQLTLNNAIWTDLDVTKTANGQTADSGSALACFSDAFGYHVLYIGADSLRQLYFDNVIWVDQDLTSTAKGPQLATGSGLSGFADAYGEHAFYIASNQHVHHLIYAGNTWVDQDLTALTNGPQAAAASALSSFGDSYGDHVFYIGADQHVHQLYFDNHTWVDQDLTSSATPVLESAVPSAATGSALSSLTDTAGEQVFYISADQHVHLFCYANAPLGAPPQPAPLAVTCPTSSLGKVGAAYSSSFGASGGATPYTFAISGSLPPGLGLNSPTGAITGTPTTAGTFPFTVTVTDANGTKATTSCAIVITSNLALSCPPANTGLQGEAYSSSFAVSGGTTPYVYVIASGSLPPGLGLNSSTGAVTGTPSTAGTFSFSATVTDATGATATISCGIAITPPFLISAVQYVAGAQSSGVNGPQTGLTFQIFPTGPALVSAENPAGQYQVFGVKNGNEITLGASWVNSGFQIVNAMGNVIGQAISVTIPQTSPPYSIIVGGANPF